MGAYVQLKGGEGHLAFFDALDPQRAKMAEEKADNHIDVSFGGFDRSLWSVDNAPTEVRIIAQQVASAAYIELATSGANPNAGRTPQVLTLRQDAERLTANSLARGYLTSADGQRVTPEGSQGGLNPRILR